METEFVFIYTTLIEYMITQTKTSESKVKDQKKLTNIWHF